MPLLSSYDWGGLPGLIAAAPTFQYFDAVYCEQMTKEQWNVVLEKERYEITTPWAREVARRHWEMYKPWWTRF